MSYINLNCHDLTFRKIIEILPFSDIVEQQGKYSIIFIEMEELDSESRTVLRTAINKYPKSLFVIVSSNPMIAKFAWNLGIFHFLSHPLSDSHLNVLKTKVLALTKQEFYRPKLKLPFGDGYGLFLIDDLCVVEGDGSYCFFYFRNQQRIHCTGRISKIWEKIEFNTNLLRLNQSLIVNVNHLTHISGQYAKFIGKSEALFVSQKSISILKKALFWE